MAFKTTLVLTALFLLSTVLYLRLIRTLPGLKLGKPTPPLPRQRGSPTHLLIVLGSGGHTAEMFSLLHSLDPYSYTHRSYVISAGDSFSASKAAEFERSLSSSTTYDHTKPNSETNQKRRSERARARGPGTYSTHTVPRARDIHQPLLTTPFSALRCLSACLILLRTRPRPDVAATPDLILLNGPGTAVIVVLASLILRFLGLEGGKWERVRRRTRTIYVESWARVKRLSLSGRILAGAGAVDRLLVQWEPLRGKGRAEWMGWMVR